jgi:NAD(P)-dependent dehydrogenase (short-subunit alcohol dehydrogenase family)
VTVDESTYPGPPAIENWNRLLDGRIAVVSGGAGGIGGAISSLFAEHGAHVELVDIDGEAAEQRVASILESGGSARAHVADVQQFEVVERIAADVLTAHPNVDVLVNNVGDYRPLARFRESTPESWKSMFDINLFHMFAMTRAFLESMIGSGGGSIVNVHSVEGMRGYPGDPVYGAMKAAAAAFTTDLAVGMGRHGIRVNGIGLHRDLGRPRAALGVLGAGGSIGMARRSGPGGAVPRLGPLLVRHRTQHPCGRRDTSGRWMVLVSVGTQVRQPTEGAVTPVPHVPGI